MSDVEKKGWVIIFGAGVPDGLGGALARRFAKEGHPIFVTGRTEDKIKQIAAEVEALGGTAAYQTADVTNEADVKAAFDAVERKGPIATVLYNAGNNAIIPFLELTPAMFEDFWRVCTYGAFLVGQETLRRLLPKGEGNLFFTGASGSLRGKAQFAHFASAKAGLRNLAQSMAREFGPQGIHVGHVIVDGVISGDRIKSRIPEYLDALGDEGSLVPDAIADAFWALHIQQRSAWSHEIDVRPFKENW